MARVHAGCPTKDHVSKNGCFFAAVDRVNMGSDTMTGAYCMVLKRPHQARNRLGQFRDSISDRVSSRCHRFIAVAESQFSYSGSTCTPGAPSRSCASYAPRPCRRILVPPKPPAACDLYSACGSAWQRVGASRRGHFQTGCYNLTEQACWSSRTFQHSPVYAFSNIGTDGGPELKSPRRHKSWSAGQMVTVNYVQVQRADVAILRRKSSTRCRLCQLEDIRTSLNAAVD